MAWGIRTSICAGQRAAGPLPRQIFERLADPRSSASACGDSQKLLLCHWRTRTFFESLEPSARFFRKPPRSRVLASAGL